MLTAGRYSEHAFQALDYILDEASKYGVRLLLTLVNNWDNADSKTQVCYTACSPFCPPRLHLTATYCNM